MGKVEGAESLSHLRESPEQSLPPVLRPEDLNRREGEA
jgi:hypothetical protein